MKNNTLIKKVTIVGVLFCIILTLWLFISPLLHRQKNLIQTTSTISSTRKNNNTEPTVLKVLSISPKDGSSTILAYTTFTITFNKLINQNEITVSFSPSSSFTTRIDKNSLYIDAPNLGDNTAYTLTLISPLERFSQSFHFTTIPAKSALYNDTVGQDIDAWTKVNRPDVTVYNNLPASSVNFSLQPVSSPGHYSFIVLLKNADKNTATQAFLDWLKTTVGLSSEEIAKLDIHYQ